MNFLNKIFQNLIASKPKGKVSEVGFTDRQMLYILTNVSKTPVNIRDEQVFARISQMRDPLTQAREVVMKKPFQDYNEQVGFVMCQFVVEKAEKPDGIISTYRTWLDLRSSVGG